MLLNQGITIKHVSEQPDFTIELDNKLIGLEHQILIDPKTREIEGFYENLFLKAEADIKADTSIPNFHSNCYVVVNQNIPLANKNLLIEEIKSVVKTFLRTGELINNDIISGINVMDHTEKSISPNFGAWWQNCVTPELLHSAIQHKEFKLSAYRKNTVARQWLLIVIGSLNQSSFEVHGELEINLKTDFEKVYLLEDFKNILYELK